MKVQSGHRFPMVLLNGYDASHKHTLQRENASHKHILQREEVIRCTLEVDTWFYIIVLPPSFF